jgi:methyltransferase family protein/glycosyl transferase family 2
MNPPRLSVVVVAYDMQRELPRTLLSLSPGYQREIDARDYEVIVIDNGSPEPVEEAMVQAYSPHWRLIRVEPASPSPAKAINFGIGQAAGELVGVMIDGARIATPGILRYALAGAALTDRAVITTTSWNLGWDSNQTGALQAGYDQAAEDRLLASIDWAADGYRLFDVGAPNISSVQGWLQPISETCALFMKAALWHELGGADERFDMPSGGFVNPDMLRRALELPEVTQVVLLGEATFHQLHGDLDWRRDWERRLAKVSSWVAQYRDLTGRAWEQTRPQRRVFVGDLRGTPLLEFTRSAVDPVPNVTPPLGGDFDISLWSSEPYEPSGDPRVDGAVELAHAEFKMRRFQAAAHLCRAARARLGDVPALMRLLALTTPMLPMRTLSAEALVEIHVGLGALAEHFGDADQAIAEYQAALAIDGTAGRAHHGLARVSMPGLEYRDVLRWLHATLRPSVYLEIGVAKGDTLVLAQPPTVAIGVDPSPRVRSVLKAETHVYAMPSDEFFSTARLPALLGDRRVDLAFIDGLHRFDQVLRDVANIERWSSSNGVILLHDTYALNETTQDRDRRTKFWTGDVWKAVACLREVRPDLDIFTIAAEPAGLTVIRGLDPASIVLWNQLDTLVERYIDIPFEAVRESLADMLDLVPSNVAAVGARLRRMPVTALAS